MESPDPFTPGFGEFQGIPNRTLPDDCMEYTIFALSAADPRARLTEVKAVAEELAAKWAEGYIWQREGFQLELVEKKENGEGRWCLQGRTEYGDAVDDEWFIVWMLRELSKGFEDLWIRVYDTDGEFLLIEAANALPRWLNPEIADHRVWLHAGHLLTIPLSASAPSARTQPISRPLTLSEALTHLSAPSPPATHLSRIRLLEEEAFYRTLSYPSSAAANHHHTRTTIPRTLAALLHAHPAAIAAATEAFYLRDPISLKALNPPTFFPPTDLVTVTTHFTKTLYAQLKSQSFTLPPGFPADSTSNALDIGTKLTCGFEMLLRDAHAPQLSSPSRRSMVNTLHTYLSSSPRLPSDTDIASWPQQSDSEDWLDVDYTAFEATLQGRPGHKGTQNESGWGDRGAEENLKRMVERFEAFLNDEDAGVEGVEDMDVDDDSSEEEEGEEDREVSFDESEFERMMREMMGLPEEAEVEAEVEERKVREVMDRVEAELREAGALETAPGGKGVKEVVADEDEDEDEDEDGEVNIDYTLAANMLESFKGQAGMSGPGGNLLARMGIVLPRDDPRGGGGGDGKEKEKEKGKGKEIKP